MCVCQLEERLMLNNVIGCCQEYIWPTWLTTTFYEHPDGSFNHIIMHLRNTKIPNAQDRTCYYTLP